jgi:hypothetical protein
MRRFCMLLITLLLLTGQPGSARAQSVLQVSDVQINYAFGQVITFSAHLRADAAIQSAELAFQAEGTPNPRTAPISVDPDGQTEYTYPVKPGVLRPFVRITFWFQVTLAGGESVQSPRYYFTYDDNRHAWQTLQEGNLRVHWYDGDAAFGQAALLAAQAGLQTVQAMLPTASASAPTDVYIYASASDVQDTLGLGGLTWVSGHASPDLGVVLVSVAPGEDQATGLDNEIPHELAHVLLYRMTGPAYNDLPTWLREGLASLAEQAPNPDETRILSLAAGNKTLLPLADLCGLFPQDVSGASLAYAESASFTRYLGQTYGTAGLQELIQAYASGESCKAGTTRALGLSLPQLEVRWQHAALGMNAGGIAFLDLLPYLVVLLAILVGPGLLIGLSLRRKGKDDDEPK